MSQSLKKQMKIKNSLQNRMKQILIVINNNKKLRQNLIRKMKTKMK